MEELTTLLVNGGIVAALLEATKRALGTHFDWFRYGAYLALIVGVGTAVAGNELGWYPVPVTYGQAIFAGLMAGITASGLNRAITQNASTVVVEGSIAAQPATASQPATPAATATAVIQNPTVTDDAGVRESLEAKPIARLAPPPR